MSSNQSSDHYDIWTSRYFSGYIYLLHNDEFYKINSSDQLEFVSNIASSGSSENILTGGMGSNYPFFYAHVGGQIYQSINGGNSWIDRGEKPQWYFNLQNSFNSSNINRDLLFWGGMEVFKSTNGGNSWSYYANHEDTAGGDTGFFINPSTIDPAKKAFYSALDATSILRVLARSATGQEMSSYTTFSTGISFSTNMLREFI